MVEECGVPDHEERGERHGSAALPPHDEPPSSVRDQRLALEGLKLIQRVGVLDVEQAHGLGVRAIKASSNRAISSVGTSARALGIGARSDGP